MDWPCSWSALICALICFQDSSLPVQLKQRILEYFVILCQKEI